MKRNFAEHPGGIRVSRVRLPNFKVARTCDWDRVGIQGLLCHPVPWSVLAIERRACCCLRTLSNDPREILTSFSHCTWTCFQCSKVTLVSHIVTLNDWLTNCMRLGWPAIMTLPSAIDAWSKVSVCVKVNLNSYSDWHDLIVTLIQLLIVEHEHWIFIQCSVIDVDFERQAWNFILVTADLHETFAVVIDWSVNMAKARWQIFGQCKWDGPHVTARLVLNDVLEHVTWVNILRTHLL